MILYQPLDTLYHITVGHDVSRYETMYPVVESSCPRSIRKVKPLDTGHDVMEVLYYFICSVSYSRAQQERMNPKKPVLHAPSHITCVKKVWHAILGFLWFILLCWNQVFVDID